MIDVVIPFVKGRHWEEKLRYVLRSFQLNFKEDFSLSIIGYLPDWCRDIIHIPFADDITRHTEFNLGKKLKIAQERYSEFIWTYDDIYFLQPVTLQDIAAPKVNEYLGLYSKEQRGTGPHFDQIWATYDRCLELGLPGYSFQNHLPYYFESAKLAKAFELFNIEAGEHLAQTAYFNLFFPGKDKLIWDHNKVVFYSREDFSNNPDFGRAKFLNHNDDGLTPRLRKRIKKLFPEKSKFEK
ncbi:MAG: hypothetical protein AMJ60_10515 [Desulfobacterales bacterium SG8_35]|nr:MAG: hypothetical protein AMJ60_10515 [Desulfobacterales bacterium SG8_35]